MLLPANRPSYMEYLRYRTKLVFAYGKLDLQAFMPFMKFMLHCKFLYYSPGVFLNLQLVSCITHNIEPAKIALIALLPSPLG
jgi:hypothetical protein